MKATRILIIIFCLLLFVKIGDAQQFKGAMKKTFGKQFKDYQWLDYPLDNFGVGTAYRDTKEATNPKKFLCATFTCLNIIPIPTAESQLEQWLYLKLKNDPSIIGFADVGTGGEVTEALKKNSGLQVTAFLPKLLSVIGITGDVKYDTKKDTTINFINGRSRILNGQMITYIKGLQKDEHGLKSALFDGELVLVKGDVVITSLDITVKSTSDLKVALDGKLLGAATKTFGDEAKLGVKVTRGGNNDYHLKTTSPVIVGVLAVRQPRPLGIIDETNIPPLEKWQKVEIPLPTS